MDFKLQTDLNTLPSVIEFNYSELKAEMTERLKYYNNLVAVSYTHLTLPTILRV